MDIMNLPIRDDLNPVIVKEISSLGWSYEDGKRVGDSRTFEKDLTTVWECIHRDKIMWARADTIGGRWINHCGKPLHVCGRYTNHFYYGSLLNAIKGINGQKRGKYYA